MTNVTSRGGFTIRLCRALPPDTDTDTDIKPESEPLPSAAFVLLAALFPLLAVHSDYLRPILSLPSALPMGQSTSRSTPTPPAGPRSTSRSQSSIPPSLSSIRGYSDQPRNSSPSSPRSHRPSAINRTIRHLLPQPRSTQTSSPSIRKRWRSSRRFSKQPSPLPNLPDSTTDDLPNLPTPIRQPDPHIPISDTASQPCHSQLATPPRHPLSTSLSTHPSPLPLSTNVSDTRSFEQLSPTQSQPSDFNPPHVDLPQSPTEVPELTHPLCHANEQANDFSSDCKADQIFVQGSSQDSQRSTPPLSSESRPHSSPLDPQPDPPPDPQPQLPRHFQSPGPLVVVQGVVNTSDNSAVNQTSSNSRTSRPSSTSHIPSFIPPVSHRRSISSPRNDSSPEERQTTRRRLSAFIPRPSSMLGRRPLTPDPASVPSHNVLSGDGSGVFQTTSPEPSVSRDDSSTSSEQEPRSSGESDRRRRPLSPGSVDVLGTLLRCVQYSAVLTWILSLE